MQKFIDSHPMGSLTAEQLKQLQTAPKDKFGVTHHDILYNKKEDRVYRVLDATSKDAVANHHKGAGSEGRVGSRSRIHETLVRQFEARTRKPPPLPIVFLAC